MCERVLVFAKLNAFAAFLCAKSQLLTANLVFSISLTRWCNSYFILSKNVIHIFSGGGAGSGEAFTINCSVIELKSSKFRCSFPQHADLATEHLETVMKSGKCPLW